MCSPRILCTNHLLGEHKELHMLVGCIARNKSLNGYVENGLIETHNIKARHDALVREMGRRGWPSGLNHKTPISEIDLKLGRVNRSASLEDLLRRCRLCMERYRYK